MNKTLILISTLTIAIFSLLIVGMAIMPNLDSRTSASVDENLQDLQKIYNSKVSEAKASMVRASFESAQAEIINTPYQDICWNNVVHQTDGYYWKNGCKGKVISKNTVCTEEMPTLSTGEMFSYLSWQAEGSVLNPTCNQVLGVETKASSSVSASSTSSAPIVTNYDSCKKYDLNSDKSVNSTDLNLTDFNKYLNRKVTSNKYDFDGNKIVNSTDLNMFVQAVADFAVGNNCK